ncbi:MAG: NAD-dependent epimerase/dehydratase family protein [Candidatus Cloacimonas sp.]|nr:NAD-dependent epimerase/dehydratase family protein [Candidatus Cloacimonadota bacterium]
MLKVAITGVNGFLGSNLLKGCLEKGYDVRGLVRSGARTTLLPDNFEPTVVNYWDSKDIERVLSGQEILIHNAGITRGKDWGEFDRKNVEMTAKILQVVNHIDSIKQVIFISSQAAAGMCKGKRGKLEVDECTPITYYGKSKLLAEREIMANCSKNWTIIRPASVFGAGDRDFLQYFKLVKHKLALLVGFKDKYVSLIYINDLVDLIIKTIGNEEAYEEIFFASSEKSYSWDEFIDALEKATDKKTVRIRVPEFLVYPIALFGELKGLFCGRPALINLQKAKEIVGDYWICDSSKAKQLLNFDTEEELSDKLKATYLWYKEHKWL